MRRLHERTAFGRPLADKQLMRQHVFDSYAEIQSARLLTLHAAQAIDRGEQARVEIGAIKVVGARMLHNVIDRAIQVYGAAGLTPDTPWTGCTGTPAPGASTTVRTRCTSTRWAAGSSAGTPPAATGSSASGRAGPTGTGDEGRRADAARQRGPMGSDETDRDEILARALGPGTTVTAGARLPGGASRETWALDAVDPSGAAHELILRLDPPGSSPGPGSGWPERPR
nr:hypothetical protein GCM10020093_015100 [Planobispora longispora]